MSDNPQAPDWWQASDGKWYPPQPPAAPAPLPPPGMPPPGMPPPQPLGQPYAVYPQQPVGKKRNGCLIASLIGVGVLAVGFVGCAVLVGNAAEEVGEAVDEAGETQREREREIAEDVELGACRVDDLGFMVADLTVTNNSSERSNYQVEVTFEGPDGAQLATGGALVSALEPGQSTDQEANSLTQPAGEFTCRVVDVSRFSDQLGESPREQEIAEDVELGACRVDDLGFMVADLTVTNNSSERSNYQVEVTFEGPDGAQLATGPVFVSALEPGQSTAQEANSLTQPAGEFTCRVVDVTRFSDE